MFLAKDVVKITEANRQEVQAWMQEGLMSPSIHVAEGHGDRNIWSATDLYKIATFKKLRERGIQRKHISELLKTVPDLSRVDFRASFLFFVRKDKKLAARMIEKTTDEINQNREPVVDFDKLLKSINMTNFDDIFIINFQKIKADIDSKILESHKDFFGNGKE
ncbi:MerR family transcriptional regulator [Thermodesulfobacteriota bacterium]